MLPTTAPGEVIAEAWRELFGKMTSLPRARWDHLFVQLSPEGLVIAYPDRCFAPFARREHLDIKAHHHFELALMDEYEVWRHVPAFDDSRVVYWGEDPPEGAADGRSEHCLPLLSEEGLHELQEETLRASLALPDVAAQLDVFGGPATFGVFAVEANSKAEYCVNYRHLWGRHLPPLAPARSTVGALAPLYWHVESVVVCSPLGLRSEGDAVVAALFEGPMVTDATLALLTPESALACASLRSLVLAGTRVSAAAVARLERLLPHVTVEVRARA